MPRFGFDFVDGGATEEYCIKRNIDAFQAIELMPRYCIEGKANTEVTLFGRKYAAPIGVAPMGSAGLMWPGAEKMFAAEAQKQNIPYVLATPGNASIEEIAAIAPDVFWFQLYRFPYDDHEHHLRPRAPRRRGRRACAGADRGLGRQVEAAARHPQRHAACRSRSIPGRPIRC